MTREVYQHVPDMPWPGWSEAAGSLLARLGRPMTTGQVLDWCLGPRFDVGLGKMGQSRRQSLARNMLAWLSVRGQIDYSRGKWRRTRGATRVRKI